MHKTILAGLLCGSALLGACSSGTTAEGSASTQSSPVVEPTAADHAAVVSPATTTLALANETDARTPGSSRDLELFGVHLHDASRASLRQAFKASGMSPKRERVEAWVDTYNPHGALAGATEFEVGYVSATQKFAYAEYMFASFMDTSQVGKIARMVSIKYGEPTRASGIETLGEVAYEWDFPDNMMIRVARGWPATTTYLSYRDGTAFSQMQAEMADAQRANDRKRAESQSSAF